MEDKPASLLRGEDSLLPLHSHCRSLAQSIYTLAVSIKKTRTNKTASSNEQGPMNSSCHWQQSPSMVREATHIIRLLSHVWDIAYMCHY